MGRMMDRIFGAKLRPRHRLLEHLCSGGYVGVEYKLRAEFAAKPGGSQCGRVCCK
jgi:hypothetical protein